ncbi:MAG: 3-oxoacyl-[acyl-carrier-protein] reductase [Flavobacteriaceae bacterium]|nr:3-oxoacyl-[acyl-carrier-protein] reductase [Flavobacteriaceae bacterium]
MDFNQAADLLKGKTALITGASQGIGKEIAYRYERAGADIAFTYISSKDITHRLEEELTVRGVKCKGYRVDAADHDATHEMVRSVIKHFGRIDVLINNAGITDDGLLIRMSEESWDRVINVNLKSCFNTTKAVLPYMIKQRSGSIINVSSVVGLKGNAGQANYSASKAGIIGFTKSVALEYGARGIRCNAIAPGFIETEMTEKLDPKVVQQWRDQIPLRRGGNTDDVAEAAMYLGSDLAGYVTGQVLQVDGGMLT